METPDPAEPSFCVIIPALNEAGRITELVSKVLTVASHVVVIDDGSSDDTGHLAETHGASVIRHARNLGKGASLMSGFAYARDHHFDAVITMDADGQHDPAEIPRFYETYRRTQIPVLVGNRMWDVRTMPWVRRWTNRLMSRLLCRIMKTYLPDTQCGFRLYRTEILPFVPTGSQRFAMESEILLHLALRAFRMDNIRITTIYRGEKSRINPLVDTFRFFMMLIRFHHDRQLRRVA